MLPYGIGFCCFFIACVFHYMAVFGVSWPQYPGLEKASQEACGAMCPGLEQASWVAGRAVGSVGSVGGVF